MKTIISLDARERDTIERTISILEEYSRIYSASVKGKRGIFFDNAGTAIGQLKTILEESAGADTDAQATA